jgi:ethanolamine utilization protein EutP (predicted NTPase)
MKRMVFVMLLAVLVVVGVVSFGTVVSADEIKMVGVITKIDIAGKDAKTATVTLKDNKTEELITITVNDDMTLDKFKDHRIVEGDEIRCKYEAKDGKNVSTIFKKTAGC